MQLYGTSQNISSFKNCGLKMLEEAKMNYHIALPQVEIYLGAVFREEAKHSEPYQFFDTEIDDYRELYGEKAVRARIFLNYGHELGHMVQRLYFPTGSPRWKEIEHMLGHTLDYNEYYCSTGRKKYCPAEEMAADLFDHALKGYREITLTQVSQFEYRFFPELNKEVMVPTHYNRIKVSLNPHSWRKWFYALWGQDYEWGHFRIGEKEAVANGTTYVFEIPPQVIKRRSVVPPRALLEAHGFKVKFHDDGTVEYWR